MDGKISVVTLVVANQAKALEFYTHAVGFDKKTDINPTGANRWVTVGPNGSDLELSLWEAGSATDPSQREAAKQWAPGHTPPIVITVKDCAGLHREMSARGVHFTMAPKENPWGTTAAFQDPDGNLFSLNQPRASPGKS
jgi:predicted enzyme related to lactoylglutathione lyase